jgi:catechol 2,3-dioxygenase-like lactoylglutathione lyase family enzyme
MASDPLDRLRVPLIPVDPRPEFADALLYRIEDRNDEIIIQTATVRYFVDDLDRAVAFYCEVLDFEEEMRPSPLFAMLYRGQLRLLLSVPSTHVLADGTVPQSGGWNRISLQVSDLDGTAAVLRELGAPIRNDVTTGVTVKQILVEDPSGNLVELFEPLAGYHERPSRSR